MHVHMLLLKDGQPVFSDDNGYSHLSETAHYFMGGLLKHISSLCALDALEADHDYLTAGGVFPERLIQNFIANKRKECSEMSKIPHPAEFDRYFNL